MGNTNEIGITGAQGGGPFQGTINVDVDVSNAGTLKAQVAGQDFTFDLQGHAMTISAGQVGRDMGNSWSTWRFTVADSQSGGTFAMTGRPNFLQNNKDGDAEIERAEWVFTDDVSASFSDNFNVVDTVNGASANSAMAILRVQDNASLSLTKNMRLGDNAQTGVTGAGMTGELHIKDQGSATINGVMKLGGDDGGTGTPGLGFGRIRITGSQAALDVAGPGLVIENGEVVFEIDDLAGPTAIDVADKLRIDTPAAVVDLDLLGVTPTLGQTFTLFTYGVYEDNSPATTGLQLAAEDLGAWQLINDTAGKRIVAEYILAPEPTSMMLLMVFGGALLVLPRSTKWRQRI